MVRKAKDVTLGTGTSHEEGKRQFEETKQEVERRT